MLLSTPTPPSIFTTSSYNISNTTRTTSSINNNQNNHCNTNNTTPMSRNGVVGSAAVINGSMTTQSGSGVVGSGGSGDKPDGAVHPQRRLKIRQCARATRRSLLSGERRDSTDTGSLIATGRITVLGGTDASTTQGLSTTEPSGRRIVSRIDSDNLEVPVNPRRSEQCSLGERS